MVGLIVFIWCVCSGISVGGYITICAVQNKFNKKDVFMSFLFAVLGLLGLVYYLKTLFDTVKELEMEQTVDVEITDGLEQLQTAICNSLDLALQDGVDMDVAVDAIKKTVKEAIPDVDMNNIVDDIYLRWYEFVKGE
jgi:F0F1-type ATP synthase membrane subunit c/vacuolar-type H+-ATPase subunit K